jgi:NAD(P) transhydrogenase subunit alpha
MKVAVLKEKYPGETRVAATPETVKKMVALGLDVLIEKGAGDTSSFPDSDYKEAGAKIVLTAEGTLKEADILLTVRVPKLSPKKGAFLIGQLSPYINSKDIATYAKDGLTTISLELIPRISRAQGMDVLSSQANLGGYRAVLEACSVYGRSFPLMMTAAGTIVPARVLVIGAGVAGLQAIATAKRLGAIVSAFDVRPAVKEQVQSLGAKFIEVDATESGEGSTGYAKEMSAAYLKRQALLIAETLKTTDVVITTALIPGKPAPRLITAGMVADMKPGSVIVDMAVESGGNVEGTQLDKVVLKNGITLVGYSNLPARLPAEASNLYARNIFNFLQLIWDGTKKKLTFDLTDEILKGSTLTHDGQIIHPSFQKAVAPKKAPAAPTPKTKTTPAKRPK